MIKREDILSIPFLKKSEYTGCSSGMRYRLEKVSVEDTDKLLAIVWPEPFNFIKTPEEKKEREYFDFSEEGIVKSIEWMNSLFESEPEKWNNAGSNWEDYEL